MVPKKKTVADTQKINRKESNYITAKIINYKRRQQEGKKGMKNCIWKKIHKMAIESPYLLIITLNINGLNSLIKRHRIDRNKNPKSNYMVPTRDSL